jgi:hypothetical protein
VFDVRIGVDDLQHDALAFLVGLVPQAREIARDNEVRGLRRNRRHQEREGRGEHQQSCGNSSISVHGHTPLR